MRHSPLLVVAILLYVTLDLSSPAIPGAFVFDTKSSVESTETRVRAADDGVKLPAPACDLFALSRPVPDQPDRVPPSVEGERPRVLGRRSLPRLDPAASTEDPH